MATVDVGIRHTSSSGEWYGVGASSGVNTQALVRLTADQPYFLHRLGARLQRSGANNAQVQLAVWADDAGLPGALLGYTASFAVGATATTVSRDLAWTQRGVDIGVAAAAVALEAGQKVWLGVQVEGAGVNVSIDPAAPTLTVYRRQTSGNPPNPYGTSTATTTVKIPALFGEADTDDAPVVTLTGPAATVATAEPVIAGTVADAQSAAPASDRMFQSPPTPRSGCNGANLRKSCPVRKPCGQERPEPAASAPRISANLGSLPREPPGRFGITPGSRSPASVQTMSGSRRSNSGFAP